MSSPFRSKVNIEDCEIPESRPSLLERHEGDDFEDLFEFENCNSPGTPTAHDKLNLVSKS